MGTRVIPAFAGMTEGGGVIPPCHAPEGWIPAFAGMTEGGGVIPPCPPWRDGFPPSRE